MEQNEAVELAEEIVRLDMLRDEMLEKLQDIAGTHTFELLRSVQNRGFRFTMNKQTGQS
ncbi:hypothetical protein PP175_19060 [Aneurinibacillus sp. Ricciae_BoGa-3]|uniref:hypothetical protein n=1 Tax=Aneurinibacillus sp. Ricciae_BoGa-3 TaxID=3022697 RepID=UPI002340FDF4|nr:hypothetical protein [Aneurinibacillus sp. Ricciae_BoGa-3]WCK53429.1 hypothetical protein PP175_19060 [Aneurinibacillus sp. Ricciae_BoGa-3]